MGFGNSHYTGKSPKTLEACETLWANKSRSVRHGRLKLGHDTYLEKADDRFYAIYHNTHIVTYYPDHKEINAGGWSGSITTQGRINALAGVCLCNRSDLGYHEKVRINGFPFFNGIRVDNYGQVFKEDQRPDTKTVHVKEVVQKYVKLWRRITKVIIGRWELKEWAESDKHLHVQPFMALLDIETMLDKGETFIPHELFGTLLLPNLTGLEISDLITKLRDSYRAQYYRYNNGYTDIEVS